MRPALLAAEGISLVLYVVFLLLGCLHERGGWWPLFNVFFVILALVPSVFGSLQSSGLWGAIGDFLQSFLWVSCFAFPIVLYDIEQLGGEVRWVSSSRPPPPSPPLPSPVISVASSYA